MENKEKDTVSLKSIFVKYLRHWKFFLLVFILSFIPAILYLKLYPPTYEVVASIQLQDDKESNMASFGIGEAAGLMKSFGIGAGGGSVRVDDEMAVLMSNRMLRMMILDLGLNVTYSKPNSFYRMYDDSPLRLSADSVTMAQLDDEYNFVVSVAPENVKVKATSKFGGRKKVESYTSLPAKITVGENDFVLDFNDRERFANQSFKLKIKCVPVSWMAEDLGDNIEIEEESSASNVLGITCSDHSRKRGKDMLNTLIRKYNEDVQSYKRVEDNKTMEFVDARIAKVVTDLAAVEQEIEIYKTKNDMTMLESDVLMYSETMKELQSSIIEMESQAHVIDMLDEYVKDPVNKYNVIPSLLTAADGEKSGTISTYNEAIVERDRLLRNSNETNPIYKIADNQVTILREGVYVMIENARKSYGRTLGDLKKKEKFLLDKMKTVPEKEREYVNYHRDREILQGIYLMLLQKREETVLSLGKDSDRARVIEPAFVKKKPLGPRKLYAAVGMLVLTLVIPVGWLLTKNLYRSVKEEYKQAK